MTGHGSKFGRKKEEAIAALLSHRSIEEAAQAINIAPKTLLRWLQLQSSEPLFARRGGKESIRPLPGCSRLLALLV